MKMFLNNLIVCLTVCPKGKIIFIIVFSEIDGNVSLSVMGNIIFKEIKTTLKIDVYSFS